MHTCRKGLILSDIKFGQKPVQPSPPHAKPAAAAHLPAPETENEIAVTVFLERKSGLNKLKMGIAAVVCINHRIPDGQHAGIQQRIALAQTARKEQIRVVSRKQADRTANNLALIPDYKDLRTLGRLPQQRKEKVYARKITMNLGRIITLQQSKNSSTSASVLAISISAPPFSPRFI